jgi:hypothetical protein
MSKFFNFLEKYDNFKKPIQWGIYILIAIVAVSTLVGIIFGVRSCKSNNTIETVEAKYFMNEVVEIHDNFDIKVYYAKTVDSISYQKEKDSTEKTTLTGNYIEVNLDITKNIDSEEEDHKLDVNDFKLRNHSGVYLPLNDIMGLFNIDALDVHIDTDENGFVMSEADFSNKNAVKDFSWVGTVLKNGETMNITLFFKMSEGYHVEKTLMLLEVDFYPGRSGIKKGEDIVLLNCKRSEG